MTRFLLFCLALTVAVAVADDANQWEFYQRNPQLQGWFPFGIYAGGTNRLLTPDASARDRSEWMMDLQALQGCNAIWGQHPSTYNYAFDENGMPTGCNDYGKWFYGESLPEREMRTWAGFANWLRYSLDVWGDLRRPEPLPTAPELAAKMTALAPVVAFARHLRDTYPNTVIGFITDDEPSMLCSAVAAQQVLAEGAGAPSMTCLPSWGAFQNFARHMQPITGDFYVTGDGGDNSWEIATRMTWLRENCPQRVFHFLPLASAYTGGHEETLPDLKDSRPSVEDMRMQFWMSLAGGCKGYYYYHLVYNTWWAHGEDNLLNLVLQPNGANGGLWAELGRLAPIATAIGPCLLPCQSLDPAAIEIDCGTTRFLEYQGPTIGVGLLQDIPHAGRYFVIPWNNDLRAVQSGTLKLPAAITAGSQVYDLQALAPVAAPDGRLAVDLEPGGGRVYLVGTDADFAACAAIVREARVRQPRVTARIRRRLLARHPQAKLEDVDAAIAAAKVAEEARNWEEAIASYAAANAAVDAQEKRVRFLLQTRAKLDELAGILSDTDDHLRTHFRVLGIDNAVYYLPANQYANKYVGPVVREFVVLVGEYLSSRIALRRGELGDYLLLDRALVLTDRARANQSAMRDGIAKALADTRLPVRVAYFTPDRYLVEQNMNFAWLYKTVPAEWFVPDAEGVWRDRQGKAWSPADWDAVWVHQLLSPDPEKVELLPALAARTDALRAFVQNGGGLVLTGIAGLLVTDLGVETVPPDRVRQCSHYAQSLTVGLSPAPGMAKHPALADLPADFPYTNANFPNHNYLTEVAWEDARPSGQVIAVEYDQLFGPIGTYAAMVEYKLGKGKVIVAGGRACDFTPGNPFGLKDKRPQHLRHNFRAVIRATLAYAAGDTTFTPDAAAIAAAGAPRQRPLCLPLTGWAFRTDPDKVGVDQQWMAPGNPPGEWVPISIGANWESQGYDYNGFAWYRLPVTLRNHPGKRTMLHFGAVDEQADVYIDGKLVGHNQGEPVGWEAWDQPFAMDVTDFLTDEDAEHLLAVRVFDISAAGGIWKPVWVEYE